MLKHTIAIAFISAVLLLGTAIAHADGLPALPGVAGPAPGLTVTTPNAPAAPAVPDQVLYDGLGISDSGIGLSAWGGGTCGESQDINFDNGHSIKIGTLDLYQGGQVTFDTPVDLGDRSDKTRYFVLTMRQGHLQTNFMSPAMTTVRLVFTLADGSSYDITRNLSSSFDHWFDIGVPISVLAFPEASATAPLATITVTADGTGTLYIGRLRITHDTTPITCFAGAEQTAGSDRPVLFTGTADGGLSTLKYAWDFDTTGQFVDQAEGISVQNRYPAGEHKYTVTLQVTDADGIKAPATSTTIVRIE